MTKFLRGDVVTIRGTVVRHYDEDEPMLKNLVSLKLKGKHDHTLVDDTEVTLVHHHFEPGDIVTFKGDRAGTALGRVQAVNEPWVWVEIVSGVNRGRYFTECLEDLEHAPEVETPGENAPESEAAE